MRTIALRLLVDRQRLLRLDIDRGADADAIAASEPGPDREAGSRIDLQRAMMTLTQAERLCVTLNLGEGMSHSQIVEAIGMPLGTVKSHIARGTAKLRARLGEQDA